MKHLLSLAAIALAGCAGHSETSPTREQEALGRELAGMRAGEAKRCIAAHRQGSPTIVDRSTVTLQEGRTLWVNRLDSPCPGLQPFNTLIVEVHGSEYCRNDKVRGLEPGSSIPGPICLLGDWVPYREDGDG